VGLPVVGELAEQVVRAGRFAIVLPVGLGDGAWSVAGGARAELYSEPVLDVQAAPDLVTRVSSGTARVSPLQPGSLLLIRDT
jgi:hypothetical protein